MEQSKQEPVFRIGPIRPPERSQQPSSTSDPGLHLEQVQVL